MRNMLPTREELEKLATAITVADLRDFDRRREIDLHIAFAVGWTKIGNEWLSRDNQRYFAPRKFTYRIDAAHSIIPARMTKISIERRKTPVPNLWHASLFDKDGIGSAGDGATAAAAICCAVVKLLMFEA